MMKSRGVTVRGKTGEKCGRVAVIGGLILIIASLAPTGCQVKKDETLESEVHAGAKSRDAAKDMQAETEKRNKEGEDVLNGK